MKAGNSLKSTLDKKRILQHFDKKKTNRVSNLILKYLLCYYDDGFILCTI